MPGELVFVLGGARSGKSDFAQSYAERRSGPVLFVATAEAGDDDMKRRIEAHRQNRPSTWDTLEEPIALESAIRGVSEDYETVLIDCLTLWVSNLLIRDENAPGVESLIVDKAKKLLELHQTTSATWIVVSNEVGLGLVPSHELGRTFRDALGRVNQLFTARADKAYFMVSGLALDLKALGARPYETM